MYKQRDFLPPAKKIGRIIHYIFFLENGYSLGKRVNNEIVSLCKIIDQSKARRLVSIKPLPLLYKLINWKCRLQGCPPLPKAGEVFQHGYLSYYVSKEGQDDRNDFLAYVSKYDYVSFTYIFMGLAEHEADKRKNPFQIRLSSTVYVHGEAPTDVFVDFQELTLI